MSCGCGCGAAASTSCGSGASLADRLQPIVDRTRVIETRLGFRNTKVFLVWTTFSGASVGDGVETEYARHELAPRPRVADVTAFVRTPTSAGVVSTGSIRVDQISTTYLRDELCGLVIPGVGGAPAPELPERVDFFWEIVEDARPREKPVRKRCRRLSEPHHDEAAFGWAVTLERSSEDRNRDGRSQYGTDRDFR